MPLRRRSGLLLQEAVVANAGTASAGDGVYTESAAASWTNPATMSFMGDSKTTTNLLALSLEMEYQDEFDSSGNGRAETFMPSISVIHV